MKKLNRMTIEILRQDLVEVLRQVETKHKIKLQVGNCTFDPIGGYATFKLELSTIDTEGNVQTKEAADFKALANVYGFKPDDLGRTFEYQNRTYTIVGLNSRSRKGPIIAKREDGKHFRFSADYIQYLWQKKARERK